MKLLPLIIIIMSIFFKAEAGVAVIVHPSNSNELEKNSIKRIFLGKMKTFPDGSQAIPISQGDKSVTTDEFNEKVLKRSKSQLRAYWSKLIFTGKGSEPKVMDNGQQLIDIVSSNPNLIGFVDEKLVTDKVKVVAVF